MNRYIEITTGVVLASAVVAVIRNTIVDVVVDGEKKDPHGILVTSTGQHLMTERPYSQVLKEWQDAIDFGAMLKSLIPSAEEFVAGFADARSAALRGEHVHVSDRKADDNAKCDGNHGAPACSDPNCWQLPDGGSPTDLNFPLSN